MRLLAHIKERITSLFFVNLDAVKVAIFWGYTLAAVGFIFQHGHDPAGSMKFLLRVMADWQWAILVGLIAASRLTELFVWRGNYPLQIGIPAMGIWIWSMIMFSTMVAERVAAMGVLYLIPISIEFWILSQRQTEHMESKQGGVCNLIQ